MGAKRVPKRLRRVVKHACGRGWTYDTTSKGHPRLTPPSDWEAPAGDPEKSRYVVPVTFALSPSDRRGDLNSISQLRRAGLDL